MTPSPVLWGQEKFRDRNNASVGFGKWFARIVAGSVRQLPYSLRVDGRQTYIVGYSYTPKGTEEPTVGTDWYPVDLDVFDNQEYASVDAFIASEDGKATLQGCGVTALVPLETAIQRLADNGINITVIVPQKLFNRLETGVGNLYLVNEQGQLVNFIEGEKPTFFLWEPDAQRYAMVDYNQVSSLATQWNMASLGTWKMDQVKTVTVDGVEYTFTAQGSYYTLTPAAGTYNG